MNFQTIIEFRTTWNNELFFKHQATCRLAKRLIRKSVLILQTRLCRQLKYMENDLTKELQNIQHDREFLHDYHKSTSFADGLQQRLKVLQNGIENYNRQIKNLVKQEKDYWKQLEQTIQRRPVQSSANIPITKAKNTTFVTHVDKNNENLPPIDSNASDFEKKSHGKVPKIRKKKKVTL